MTAKNYLSQPNQFAANETIDVYGPKNKIKNVRIIGPIRKNTQLEITITDSYFLGISPPPVRISGDLKNSASGLILAGPKGRIELKSGIIVANRHLHIEDKLVKKYNLSGKKFISIMAGKERKIIFEKVAVRSSKDKDSLSFQIDTDEANAANIKTGEWAALIK